MLFKWFFYYTIILNVLEWFKIYQKKFIPIQISYLKFLEHFKAGLADKNHPWF